MNELLAEMYRGLASAQDVQRLVDEQRPEDIHLEFKEKDNRGVDQLSDHDRAGFAKTLSGFANSDGGVLLFGVATKKHGGSIDKAHAIKPITNAEAFCGRLKSHVLNATLPPVDNVSLEVISDNGNAGFVKCLILPSDRPPHMAMPDRRYYRRSIDSFRPMDHFELEDMFGRRPRPALQLHVTLERSTPEGRPERLWFGIKNEGRSVAKYAGIHCELRDDSISKIDTANGLNDWTSFNAGRRSVGYADNKSVIHPNGIVAFCGEAIIARGRAGQALPLCFSFYADLVGVLRFEHDLLPGTTVLFDKAGAHAL